MHFLRSKPHPPRFVRTAALVTAIATASTVHAEDCASATITDNVVPGSGTNLEIGYLDAQAGGIGGWITFTIPHSATVDEVRITGSDGLIHVQPATGTQTQVSISTQGDGSPSKMVDSVTYDVELLSSNVAGAPCSLEARWQAPRCELVPTPTQPLGSAPWSLTVQLENALWDGSKFGDLVFDSVVTLVTPSASGNTTTFSDAHQVASYSAANEMVYQVTLAGPGGLSASCSLNTASTVGWFEALDAGDHNGVQVTGAPGDQGKALTTIAGELASGDAVDTYCLEIVDASTFRATTSSVVDPQASAAFDTRLFLLSTAGAARAANDDFSVGHFESEISSQVGVNNGTTNNPVIPPSYAFLAIASYPGGPLDGALNPVFDFSGGFTSLHGPAVPNAQVESWALGGGSGAYTIALQGARACPTLVIFADGFEAGSTVNWN